MDPRFFRSPAEFRRWLERNHDREAELWVGIHKRASGKGGLTYPEALDEALCFGWIDGKLRRIDDERHAIRFTPRRSGSVWSERNVRRATELVDLGRMHPSGLAALRARDPARSTITSSEMAKARLDPEEEKGFRANATAWAFFQSQPPSYRRQVTYWVASAKREETRRRRLSALIDASERGLKAPPLRPADGR